MSNNYPRNESIGRVFSRTVIQFMGYDIVQTYYKDGFFYNYQIEIDPDPYEYRRECLVSRGWIEIDYRLVRLWAAVTRNQLMQKLKKEIASA